MPDNQWSHEEPPVVRKVTLPTGGAAFAAKTPFRPAKSVKAAATARTKVTAGDVEAKFTSLIEEHRTRKGTRPPRKMGSLVRILAASAMGIGIIGFGLGIDAANTRHAADMRANQGKEASLAGSLEVAAPDSGKDSGRKLAGALAAAQKRSDELAAAQQRFAAIAYAGNIEPGTNDGRPKSSVLKSVEHRKALAGFFAPESLVLTDAQAYSFRTEDLLGPGRIDPRQPWFTRYGSSGVSGPARNAASPGSYTWKTVSVEPAGAPGVMSVVWTNTDTGTGELLAWATARYSVETGTFRTLTVNRTTMGESQQLKPTTTGTPAAATKGANA